MKLIPKLFLIGVLLSVVSAELFSWADNVNAAPNYDQLFIQFVEHHDRVYSSESEFFARRKMFQENLQRAREAQIENPMARFGVTKFSDLSPEEFKTSHLNLPDGPVPHTDDFQVIESNGKLDDGSNLLPASFSWVDQGITVPIQNQGDCGSCYAFSALENLGAVTSKITKKSPVMPSVSQVLDCNPYCDACNGCWPHKVWTYLMAKKTPLSSASDYPYVPYKKQCTAVGPNPTFSVSSYAFCGPKGPAYVGPEADMPACLYKAGPLSIAVTAQLWNSYQGGIISKCGSGYSIDHAVLLVGWQKIQDDPQGRHYWIVANSWGTDWGEEGYIYLSMGHNTCGVRQYGGGGSVMKL